VIGLFVNVRVRRAIIHIVPFLAAIILLPIIVHGQNVPEKERTRISGVIYDAKSSERIPFVHIIDVNRNAGTSADDHGNFSFTTFQGDTIKFTAIGYSELLMILDDSIENNSYQVIKLEPKAYLLESMDFYANDPMKGFYLKDIPRDTIRIGGVKGAPGGSYWNVLPNGGSGYITAFANLFNDRAQQEKKLQKILEEERMLKATEEKETFQQKTAEEKYNRELITRITDLEGGALDAFIREFKPSRNFILRATSYEIALQIVESYREYAYYHGLEVDMDEILRRAKFSD
jgi:hypothetical protein